MRVLLLLPILATHVLAVTLPPIGLSENARLQHRDTDATNPQKSLTLDPGVIADGFKNDGTSANSDPGQVKSLTSSNNFINFCLTRPDLPITNGQQIKGGSCNPAPMGLIPSTDNMPSAKFLFPPNGGNIKANKGFNVKVNIANLVTGNFVNPDTNYYAAPQQLNDNGLIVGHSHIVIEELDSLDQTDPTDPTKFVFFKGLNAAAQNGVLTTNISDGLPQGVYRISTINSAANHQPVLVAIAQRGALDDQSYFTVN